MHTSRQKRETQEGLRILCWKFKGMINWLEHFEGDVELTKRDYMHVTTIAIIMTATTTTSIELKAIKVKLSGNILVGVEVSQNTEH